MEQIDMTSDAVGEVAGEAAGESYAVSKGEGENYVSITGEAAEAVTVTGTDSYGDDTDLSGMASDGIITASELAFAASGGNVFLAQETISAHIASDPVEYYVFSGETRKFSGKDFLSPLLRQ